jgi:hypothetical protein
MAFVWGIWVLVSTGATFAYGGVVVAHLISSPGSTAGCRS